MVLAFDLDDLCGKYLTYRDLIECGKTWKDSFGQGTPIDNLPRDPETLESLERLCGQVLDLVIEKFGKIELTYGLAGTKLSNRIKKTVGYVAPNLDQHASYEMNSRGHRICKRGGAAVDFLVPGVSSREVARWIIGNTPFDRLYFYGESRPLHVSSSEDPKGEVVRIERRGDGKSIPCRIRAGGL